MTDRFIVKLQEPGLAGLLVTSLAALSVKPVTCRTMDLAPA